MGRDGEGITSKKKLLLVAYCLLLSPAATALQTWRLQNVFPEQYTKHCIQQRFSKTSLLNDCSYMHFIIVAINSRMVSEISNLLTDKAFLMLTPCLAWYFRKSEPRSAPRWAAGAIKGLKTNISNGERSNEPFCRGKVTEGGGVWKVFWQVEGNKSVSNPPKG